MSETAVETKKPEDIVANTGADPIPEHKVAKLMEIGVDDQQKVYVNWPSDKKELCIIALAEAMKLVATYESKIIRPCPVHNIMNFVKGIKK